MSKERPILFSAPMVRALLDGSKTQTRRICKHAGATAPAPQSVIGGVANYSAGMSALCPYGQPGHRIWVRETFLAYGRWETRFSAKKARDEWHFVDMTLECDRRYQYAADNPDVPLAKGRGGAMPSWYTRPAIFMPRWASRILLEIVSVRVERLQDISESDADAEGCERLDSERYEQDRNLCDRCGGTRLHRELGPNGGVVEDADCRECDTYAKRYKHLWESINGAGSWAANPWVWCIEFSRVAPRSPTPIKLHANACVMTGHPRARVSPSCAPAAERAESSQAAAKSRAPGGANFVQRVAHDAPHPDHWRLGLSGRRTRRAGAGIYHYGGRIPRPGRRDAR